MADRDLKESHEILCLVVSELLWTVCLQEELSNFEHTVHGN